jgi:hypothetical protein
MKYILDLIAPVNNFDDEVHVNVVCRSLCSPGEEISNSTANSQRVIQFVFDWQAEAYLAEVRLREYASHLNFVYITIHKEEE